MKYTVTVYMNASNDNFFGYKPGHPLCTADDLVLEVEALDTLGAAEAAWAIGNRMGADLNGRTWPGDVRSMSKGDVVKVAPNVSEWMCVEGVGYSVIAQPTNINPIEGQERVTSRPAQ